MIGLLYSIFFLIFTDDFKHYFFEEKIFEILQFLKTKKIFNIIIIVGYF